jgi:hypothetical protein
MVYSSEFLNFSQFFCQSFFFNGSSSPFRDQASYSVPYSFFTAGRAPDTSDHPVARPLPKHKRTQTQNKRTPNINAMSGIRIHDPIVRGIKAVHVLDGAATVTGLCQSITTRNYRKHTPNNKKYQRTWRVSTVSLATEVFLT